MHRTFNTNCKINCWQTGNLWEKIPSSRFFYDFHSTW